MKFCLLLLGCGFLGANLGATTIQYALSDLGRNSSGIEVQRYTFVVSNAALLANQEIDIAFDPTLFASLSNPVAESDFSVLVEQPNNPPGASGDYSAMTLIDHPSLTGPFSVDFTTAGPGVPGSLPFSINQVDATTGVITKLLESGVTTPEIVSTAPEPAASALLGIGLVLGSALLLGRRPSGAPGSK